MSYSKINRVLCAAFKVLSRCRECLQPPKADKNNKLNALTLLIWTTKALVLCNHAKSKPSLRDLLEFLNDDEVGEIASAGFDIILRDSEEVRNYGKYVFVINRFDQICAFSRRSL